MVAFSTFNAPVPADSVFGRDRADARAREVLCTNPAALGGGSAKLTTVYPSEPFAPGTTIGLATGLVGVPQPDVTTPWIESDGAYSGTCSSARRRQRAPDLDRSAARRMLNPVPDATWGLHLVDANIALGNLSRLVRKQAKSYLEKHG